MDLTPHQQAVLDYLVVPAAAVRDGLVERSRQHLHGTGDGLSRTSLLLDDVAAEPFAMSPLITGPLSAATLTLDTVLTALEVRDERFPAIFRDYGIYPLIRAGMLHAARAIYLLKPEARPDRINRLVTLAREDAVLIARAQEVMGACTCETDLITHAADLLAEERSMPISWIATDTAVLAEASDGSSFGTALVGLSDALECASRGLGEGLHTFHEAPLTLQTPWGEKNLTIELEDMPFVALAALADLVSIGWHLADRDEKCDSCTIT